MDQLAAPHDDRFLVTNPIELRAYLRQAAGAHILCSVRGQGRADSYLSRLFAIDPSSGNLVFDTPRSPTIARTLTPGAYATVELTLAHVRIHFDAAVVAIADYAGEPSLFLAPPEQLTRLQRRESFRIAVPARLPIRLTIDPDQPSLSNLKLENLSVGGACVTVVGSPQAFPVGKVFDASRLVLDEETAFSLSTRIRHATEIRLSGNLGDMRIGLQFLRPPPGFEPTVARLVNTIARDLARIKQR